LLSFSAYLIGPRWPAIIGLLLNGVGTLMLAGLGLAIFLRHGKPAGNGGEPVEIG
jgi:hypothetical protein